MATRLRKYAVQKPKGRGWETIALMDDPQAAREQFRQAILDHRGAVRLIQVDLRRADDLTDYDWSLIELHTPSVKEGGRFRPSVVAGQERAPKAQNGAAAGRGPSAPGRPGFAPPPTGTRRGFGGEPSRSPQSGTAGPLRLSTPLIFALFFLVALLIWLL